MLKHLFASMRPKQWSKNVLVFAGLLFAQDFIIFEKISQAITAFILFCLVSGSVYLFNDVIDRQRDAMHPQKKARPIAAGLLAPHIAIGFAVVFVTISIYVAFQRDIKFAVILSAYTFLTIAYSIYLKNIVILDVLVIASGFVFRAVGGTFAIQEEVSSWLIICTIFLALFMALGKRRAELISLGDAAGEVRHTLGHYDRKFLDQMIMISTTACLMAYALYTLDPVTVEKFGTRNLVLTLPFVIYGLFRYLYLMYHDDRGESPENAVLGDKASLVCIALYIVAVVAIIYY
jgi:4-hydroxybenzoate polyprenyltransferase